MAAQAGLRQTTAAQMSASAARDDAWSRLPGDLLGVVYARIPSQPDRVRFSAVCKSWRDVLSRRPPQPALPWLILSPYEDGAAERVFSPVDGTVFRVTLPAKAIGKRIVGSHDGGWVVAASSCDVAISLVIVNLFSGVEVPLSAVQRRILDAPGRTHPSIHKIIFSEEPTSKRCILAAILTNRTRLGLCRVGCRDRGWSMSDGPIWFSDIAFYLGKLYGIDNQSRVIMFDLGMTKNGASVVGDTCPLRIQEPSSTYWWGNPRINYIFTHNDKLFLAQRTKWSQEGELFIKVFELIKIDNDKATNCDYMSAEVMSLDDHALFLSVPYSRFVHVPTGSHGDVERNHIYYSHPHAIIRDFIGDGVQLKMCDNGNHMYCMEDRKISGVDRITSSRYYMDNGCPTLMWVIPPNF